MKIISNFAVSSCALLLLSHIAPAQDAPIKVGFVRLANAVAQGTGKLEVKIDGEALNEEGYDLGNVTGGVPQKPGMREVTISREGTKPGTTKVNVQVDDTTILIPFTERVPASDEEPAHWAIRILRLKQRDTEKGRSATFVSVSQNPEIRLEMQNPDGKWAPVFVKRLSIAQAPILFSRGYAPIRVKEGELNSIPISRMGNYVVLLYDDAEEKLQAINFRDYKFLSPD